MDLPERDNPHFFELGRGQREGDLAEQQGRGHERNCNRNKYRVNVSPSARSVVDKMTLGAWSKDDLVLRISRA